MLQGVFASCSRTTAAPASCIWIASLIRMPISYRANLRRTLESCSRALPNDQLRELLEPLLAPWPDEDARPAAGAGSAVPAGHLVRAACRDRLGRPFARTRLQVRHDVLAADQAEDQRRGVRRSVPDPACPAERGKRNRLRDVDEAGVIESVQHRLVRPAPRPGPRPDQEPAVRGRLRYKKLAKLATFEPAAARAVVWLTKPNGSRINRLIRSDGRSKVPDSPNGL